MGVGVYGARAAAWDTCCLFPLPIQLPADAHPGKLQVAVAAACGGCLETLSHPWEVN